MRYGRQARVSPVRRVEQSDNCAFCRMTRSVGTAPRRCFALRETALRSSALIPCLSDLTSETWDTPLLYLVYYSVCFQKLQVFFLLFIFLVRKKSHGEEQILPFSTIYGGSLVSMHFILHFKNNKSAGKNVFRIHFAVESAIVRVSAALPRAYNETGLPDSTVLFERLCYSSSSGFGAAFGSILP